jgi:hypothetical protein
VLPQITLGLFSAVGPWLPGHLAGALGSLAQGTTSASDYLRSTLMALALVAVSLWVAVRLLDRREV